MSPQNIYDNPDFFAGYRELRRTETGLNAALEQPALADHRRRPPFLLLAAERPR